MSGKGRVRWIHCLLAALLGVAGSAPASADDTADLISLRHSVDLGIYAGAIFPPKAHELYDRVAWK